MRRILVRVAVFVCVSMIPAAEAWAQFNGNISGDVQDSSRRAVVNATVSLINTANSETFTTKTDSAGDFRFVSLAPGNYKLTVSATGFTTTTVSLVLLTEQTLNVPVQLSVGSVTEKVQVTAEVPTLNTADSRTQLTLEDEAVANLPLQGRNMLALTTTAPGVV